jgi:hypothetical protein
MNVHRLTWRIRRPMIVVSCLSAAMICCLCVAAVGADKVSELQARFDHEKNPVRRAKLLEKLGDEQFEETRRAFKQNDMVRVGTVLEKYRDNARVALDGLRAKHGDADHSPAGYRQLEIHVRRAIREVDEILLMAAEEYRPPLEIVRHDLDVMDRELIHMLFRHPGEQPLPAPAGTKHAPPPTEEKP